MSTDNKGHYKANKPTDGYSALCTYAWMVGQTERQTNRLRYSCYHAQQNWCVVKNCHVFQM